MMKLLLLIFVSVVGGSSPYLNFPCLDASFSHLPFCDTSLPTSVRVKNIISRLSQGEKVSALGTGTGPLPSVGLNRYNWWSEAAHGLRNVRNNEKTPWQSNFALPITTGAAFNRSLWQQTGQQIGKEARAFMNAGNAFSTYWAPVVNLVIPRWGRNLESPSEDPFQVGEYAVYFVKGMQENAADPHHLQASCCCKHFVANQLEKWNGTDRNHFNAIVSKRDLADSYFPPFKACVQKGKVSGLMCSYNSVNGVPSCANKELLDGVARSDWGFDGYVTSDCDADRDVFQSHNYTKTPEESVLAVIQAGTDVDCGNFVHRYANSSLAKGLLKMSDVDKALERLFTVRMRLGHFDPPGPLQKISTDVICTPEAVELARDGAIQGTIMLKNAHNLLPLDPGMRILVVGPNVDLSRSMASYYAGIPCFKKYWTIADAVKRHCNSVQVMKGIPSVVSKDYSQLPQVLEAAKNVDIVVLALGTDRVVEAEALDSVSLDIPEGQKHLIMQLSAVVANPMVAVFMSGGALDLSSLLSNEKIGGILQLGQPSVAVMGVSDVLFGIKSPAARMVQTMYPKEYVNEVSHFESGLRPGKSLYPPFTTPGKTYRFYTGTPVLPFGFGLSYTTFSYHCTGTTHLLRSAFRESTYPVASYTVAVTNTGKVDSDHVVLGFLKPPGAGQNGIAKKFLFDFERIHVPSGKTVEVVLKAKEVDFTQVDEAGDRRSHPGVYAVEFGVKEAEGMGYARIQLVVKESNDDLVTQF